MVRNCGIKNCRNNKHNCPEKKFFRIPRIRFSGPTELGTLTALRREAWIRALGRDRNELSNKRLDNTDICQDHFVSGKPADLKNKTDVDWSPTVNLNIDVADKKSSQAENRIPRIEEDQIFLHGSDIEDSDLELKREPEPQNIALKIKAVILKNNENILEGERQVSSIISKGKRKRKQTRLSQEQDENTQTLKKFFSDISANMAMECTSNPEYN